MRKCPTATLNVYTENTPKKRGWKGVLLRQRFVNKMCLIDQICIPECLMKFYIMYTMRTII